MRICTTVFKYARCERTIKHHTHTFTFRICALYFHVHVTHENTDKDSVRCVTRDVGHGQAEQLLEPKRNGSTAGVSAFKERVRHNARLNCVQLPASPREPSMREVHEAQLFG